MKEKKRRTKTKKKRKTVLSDEEPPVRRPFTQEFHKNKQNQRVESHNNMAGGKRGRKPLGNKKQPNRRNPRSKGRAKKDPDDTVTESEYSEDGEEEDEQDDEKLHEMHWRR